MFIHIGETDILASFIQQIGELISVFSTKHTQDVFFNAPGRLKRIIFFAEKGMVKLKEEKGDKIYISLGRHLLAKQVTSEKEYDDMFLEYQKISAE